MTDIQFERNTNVQRLRKTNVEEWSWNSFVSPLFRFFPALADFDSQSRLRHLGWLWILWRNKGIIAAIWSVYLRNSSMRREDLAEARSRSHVVEKGLKRASSQKFSWFSGPGYNLGRATRMSRINCQGFDFVRKDLRVFFVDPQNQPTSFSPQGLDGIAACESSNFGTHVCWRPAVRSSNITETSFRGRQVAFEAVNLLSSQGESVRHWSAA